MNIKKFFVAILLMGASVASAFAQDELVFTYEDGTVIENGAEIVANEVETDPFGGVQIPSGLFMKLVDEDLPGMNVIMKVDFNGESGSYNNCGAGSCMTFVSGQPGQTGRFAVIQGTPVDMQDEWFPEEYGTATVKLELWSLIMKPDNSFVEDECIRTVTVKFVYADPTGITDVTNGNIIATTIYDLNGAEVQNPAAGVYVQKNVYADKSTEVKKILVK